MKNLLIYTRADKTLLPIYEQMVRLQIDNHYRLGRKPEDMLFVTNFPYEHNGIKAIEVGDEGVCSIRPRSTNTTIVPLLIREGIVKEGEIYWNHDCDAFQVNEITNEELGLDDYDAGLTDYGWRPRWCMGSWFVKSSCLEFFSKVVPIVESDVEDEDAVQMVIEAEPELAKRIKRMNITYDIGMRKIPDNVERATKPLKVFHFHPERPGLLENFKPHMPQDMINLFAEHGFK